MTHAQYLLWLAVWNKGIKEGLDPALALQKADTAAQTLKVAP